MPERDDRGFFETCAGVAKGAVLLLKGEHPELQENTVTGVHRVVDNRETEAHAERRDRGSGPGDGRGSAPGDDSDGGFSLDV